jgi:cell division protein FtsI (penicillin-binding protein 3)
LRQVREFGIHASSGRMPDREGRPLALSVPTLTLWMDAPGAELLLPLNAESLGRLLDIDSWRIETIASSHKSFAYLRRAGAVGHCGACHAARRAGYAQRDYRRYYPEGAVEAHVVGLRAWKAQGRKALKRSTTRC